MQSVWDWMAQVDLAGPACPLELLESLLNEAASEIRDSQDYQYVLGFFHGRLLHEKLGGIDPGTTRQPNEKRNI